MLNPTASSFESKYPVGGGEQRRAQTDVAVAGDGGHQGSLPSTHLKFPRERKRASPTLTVNDEDHLEKPASGMAGLEGYPWMTSYSSTKPTLTAQVPSSAHLSSTYTPYTSSATHREATHYSQLERNATGSGFQQQRPTAQLYRTDSLPLPTESIWGNVASKASKDQATETYPRESAQAPSPYTPHSKPLTANGLIELQQQTGEDEEPRFGSAALNSSNNLVGLGLGGMEMRSSAGYAYPSLGWSCGSCGFMNSSQQRRCSGCASVPGEQAATPLLSPATPFSPALSRFTSHDTMLVTPHLGAQASSYPHDQANQALLQTIASNALFATGAGIYGDLATRPAPSYSAPAILEQLTNHVAAIVKLGEEGEDLKSILVGGDPQLALAMGMRGLVGKEAINPWRVLGYEIPSQHFGKFGPKPALGTVAGDWQCACGRENWAKRSVCSRCYPGIEPEFKATVFQHIQPILHFVDRQAVNSSVDQDLERINEQERRLRRQYNEATGGSVNAARRYLPDAGKHLALPAPTPLSPISDNIDFAENRLRKERAALDHTYNLLEAQKLSQTQQMWQNERGSSYLQAYLADQTTGNGPTGARLEVLTSPIMHNAYAATFGDRLSESARLSVRYSPSPGISTPSPNEPSKHDRWLGSNPGAVGDQSNIVTSSQQTPHWTAQMTWDATPPTSIWTASTGSARPSTSTTPVMADTQGMHSSTRRNTADDVDETILGSLVDQLGTMGLDTDSA